MGNSLKMASQFQINLGVTGLQGVAYFKVTLNPSDNITILNLTFSISGEYFKSA